MDASKETRGLAWGMALALAAATFLTFGGVCRNGFIDYDDNTYVFLNSHVAQGLSWQTLPWAFTYVNACHWVPLTWLSYVLDAQLYGLNPAGFHLTNLLLHAGTVVLLFILLRRMTGTLWRSSFVAALFGLHPLRVESVAWVAERKDVLSGAFFMLTLLAYVRYVELKDARRTAAGSSSPEAPGLTRPTSILRQPELFYLAALVSFSLALMSKSIVVTVPFVLLLLDYWPLRRFEIDFRDLKIREILPFLREKVPFLVLAFACSIVALLAQETTARNVGMLPLSTRLADGAVATVNYLHQTVWPAKLAVYYPPAPGRLLESGPVLAILFLAVVTLIALAVRRNLPFVAVGWLWYLGTLLPVSGIVQVGSMVQADRFTYLPSIGLWLALIWSLAAIVQSRPRTRPVLAGVGCIAVALLALGSWRQVLVWRDTRTLFAHAAKVTNGNYQALTSLANVDLAQGHTESALTNAQYALRLAPRFAQAEYVVGAALQMQGKQQEALPHLLTAKDSSETGVASKARLVLCYLDAGQFREADDALDELLRLGPDPNLLLMKAALLKEEERTAEAGQLFGQLLARQARFTVDNPTLSFELAELYSLHGDNRAAAPYYSQAVELWPTFTNALNNFAWILATDSDPQVRNGARAVELAERACILTGWNKPLFLGTLAAAYAEAGRFDDAIKTAERARDQAQAAKLTSIAARNAQLLELYRQRKPCRDEPGR